MFDSWCKLFVFQNYNISLVVLIVLCRVSYMNTKLFHVVPDMIFIFRRFIHVFKIGYLEITTLRVTNVDSLF